MKYITGGFVGEEEAGMRLFQVAHDPRCSKSGVYWSWNGGPREGRGAEALERDGQISGGGGAGGGWDSIYENDQSDKVLNRDTASDLFKFSSIVTGAEWPTAFQAKSPCPTLKVVGAITKLVYAKEEAKRMKPAPGNVGGLSKRVIGSTAKVADAVVGNTVGRVAGLVGSKILGELPEQAVSGSFQAEAGKKKKYGLWRRIRRFGRGPPAEKPQLDVEATTVQLEERLQEALGEEGKLHLDASRTYLENCLGSEEECALPVDHDDAMAPDLSDSPAEVKVPSPA